VHRAGPVARLRAAERGSGRSACECVRQRDSRSAIHGRSRAGAGSCGWALQAGTLAATREKCRLPGQQRRVQVCTFMTNVPCLPPQPPEASCRRSATAAHQKPGQRGQMPWAIDEKCRAPWGAQPSAAHRIGKTVSNSVHVEERPRDRSTTEHNGNGNPAQLNDLWKRHSWRSGPRVTSVPPRQQPCTTTHTGTLYPLAHFQPAQERGSSLTLLCATASVQPGQRQRQRQPRHGTRVTTTTQPSRSCPGHLRYVTQAALLSTVLGSCKRAHTSLTYALLYPQPGQAQQFPLPV
jgi:hypothetical protein